MKYNNSGVMSYHTRLLTRAAGPLVGAGLRNIRASGAEEGRVSAQIGLINILIFVSVKNKLLPQDSVGPK